MENPARWIWKVEYLNKTNQLLTPIIYPCDKDWRLRYIENGKEIYDGKMKRFNGGKNSFEGFLIVDQME